jgi:hypothetical protein
VSLFVALSRAWAAVAGACGCEVVGVEFGSALSRTPVRDWKPPSSAVDVVEVMMDVLLLQWAGALVASCALSLARAWIAARPAYNGRSK